MNDRPPRPRGGTLPGRGDGIVLVGRLDAVIAARRGKDDPLEVERVIAELGTVDAPKGGSGRPCAVVASADASRG